MLQKVEIDISGGTVNEVRTPRGIRVIIRDYDAREEDAATPSWDIRHDQKGNAYQRMEYRHPQDETGTSPTRPSRRKRQNR